MVAASDEMEELSGGRGLWCWRVEVEGYDDERATIGGGGTCASAGTFASV